MTTPCKTITLPDSRILSYAEYGDPAGIPLIYMHGSPGSHMDWYLADPDNRMAKQRKLRIIAPDRPGISESTFQPRRRLIDWGADVRVLADTLKLDTFYVIGLSVGGMYALATSYLLPDRIKRTAIVSGVGPLDVPGLDRNMGPGKYMFRLAHWLPFVVRFMYSLMQDGLVKNPQEVIKQVAASVPEVDRKVLYDPSKQKAFLDTLAESMRHGAQGVAHEGALVARHWNIPLQDIQVAIQFWYGTQDQNVPIEMGRYLAEQIQNSDLQMLEGEGHFSVGSYYMEQILDKLMA